MDLTKHSTFREICAYCALCIEHRIKTVLVSREVRNRISEITGPIVGGSPFMGIKFRIYNENSPFARQFVGYDSPKEDQLSNDIVNLKQYEP